MYSVMLTYPRKITPYYICKLKMKGDLTMTVIAQVKQAVAGLKGAQASFETFALSTDNQNAKQLYQNAAQQAQTIIESLEPRLQEMEQEEPQYKQ